MFKKIVLLFVVLVGGFAVYVALQPPQFKIVRSAVIDAPPDVVFMQINDFHKWEAWSSWARIDPNCKATFYGPDSGKDAAMSWSGNDDVGEGTQTIVESNPNETIKIRLDFKKPMESSCITDFKLIPEGDKTRVEWMMSGENNFIGRAMCVFMNMDKMVGEQFEKSLENLNNVVKAPAAPVTPMPTPKHPAPAAQ